MNRVKEPEFWVTNICKRNVCLRDLRITIPARRSWNLLDKRHFHFTEEELIKSAESGSIFKKQHIIKVRKVAPEVPVKPGIYICEAPLFVKKLSQQALVVLEPEPVYEDLELNFEKEEEFADEISDIGTP
jgi:hypothetical protein